MKRLLVDLLIEIIGELQSDNQVNVSNDLIDEAMNHPRVLHRIKNKEMNV